MIKINQNNIRENDTNSFCAGYLACLFDIKKLIQEKEVMKLYKCEIFANDNPRIEVREYDVCGQSTSFYMFQSDQATEYQGVDAVHKKDIGHINKGAFVDRAYSLHREVWLDSPVDIADAKSSLKSYASDFFQNQKESATKILEKIKYLDSTK